MEIGIFFIKFIEMIKTHMWWSTVLGMCLIIILIFIVGGIVDFCQKDTYQVDHYHYRVSWRVSRSKEEYYFQYWAWQRYKKQLFRDKLNQKTVYRLHVRHARQKGSSKLVKLPFRKEIYGKSQD